MTTKEFDNVIDKMITRDVQMMTRKGKEYATDTDRFHNFNIASQIANALGFSFRGNPITPATVAFFFRLKHIVSEFDILENPQCVKQYDVNEKFGDDIIYAYLQRALLCQLDEKDLKEKFGIAEQE